MAKRRNLKKEKAERNKAYARKFRSPSSRSFSQKQRFSRNNQKQASDNERATD